MIVCKELNKTYSTKEELFKDLRVYKKDIINVKKSQILKSIDKGIQLNCKPIKPFVLKESLKNVFNDEEYYYVAVNATKILDSHLDLHLNGIWNKTIKEQQGKNYLVDTHIMSMGTTIVKKEHIEMFTAEIPFSAVGKNYIGNTEALIYKFPKDKVVNQIAKDWLESGDAIQGSVKMRYTDIDMAMNSDAIEDKNELKNYNNYYSEIANKEEHDEILYFFAVKQAQNIHESSLVLLGSNEATGQIKNIEVVAEEITTQKEADNQSLQKFISLIKI